jgi:L-amino acid N-acyltransferase YncA
MGGARHENASGNLMQPRDKSSSTPSPHTSDALFVRDALEADMGVVQAIYADHVRCGLATFEEVPPSHEAMLARRAAAIAAGLPYLVAERQGEVVGFAYAGAYHSRPAYRYTLEDSVYVLTGLGGCGIGTALLQLLVTRCETGRWRQMIALIGDSANVASIALHRRMGFRTAGTLGAVGFKLGRWVDTVLMQRVLGTSDQIAAADNHPRATP